MTRNGPLPPELDGLMGWIACVADARPVTNYVDELEGAGLRVGQIQAHDDVLIELIDRVRGRLLAAEVLTKVQQVELPSVIDFQLAKRLARSAVEVVKLHTLGYTLLVAAKQL